MQESPLDLIDFREKNRFRSSWRISAAEGRSTVVLTTLRPHFTSGAFWKSQIRCKMISLILERY